MTKTIDELEVLRIVSERLAELGLPFMLSGSFALAYYATPRMTRDLDFVVAIAPADIAMLAQAFALDFHIDPDEARIAVATRRMFNLMHLSSGIKVDLIVRKDEPYRLTEFERRRQVRIEDFDTWLVSPEDLILSKLVWSRESASELQRRDVRALLADRDLDRDYLRHWAMELGVAGELERQDGGRHE
jgi:hypothetical protein